MDRNFWHYKIVDFPCAMLQESCLTLAQLYRFDFPENPYFNKKIVRQWSLAVLAYCLKIQKADGSFDEFFPSEHSFSPTAFNLYAICESSGLLGVSSPDVLKAAEKAAWFLLKYGDPGASNQRIAALAGIYSYYSLSGNQRILPHIKGLLKSILDAYHREGWFPEYGGPDIGYQSIALSYLSDYYRMSKDESVVPALDGMIRFLSFFVHPDGSVGGEYGSRNTSFFAPHGFEVNAKRCPTAKSIAQNVFLSKNPKVNAALDDRYVCHFILPSYLWAIRFFSDLDGAPPLPCDGEHEVNFESCGMMVKSTKSYYWVCNFRKGGVYRYFPRSGKPSSDYGYVIKRGGCVAISNWIDKSLKINHNQRTHRVEGCFHKMMTRVPSVPFHMGLRFVAFFLGKRILPLLKKRFIAFEKRVDVRFSRRFTIADDHIEVEDEILTGSSDGFNLYAAGGYSYRYVAPTNYFSADELLENGDCRKPIATNIKHVVVTRKIGADHPLALERREP